MRFLMLASALLLPSASTAAADSPRVILPKPMKEVIQIRIPESQKGRVIHPNALGPTRSLCPAVATYQTARPGEPLRLRNLDELPHANAFAAVYRKIGGCEVPMLVGHDIGKR